MAMPGTTEVIAAVDAPLVVNQRQIGGIKTIISIDLHQYIGRNDQTGFDERRGLLEDFEAANVRPLASLLRQQGREISDIHH